jgi:dethiobiotin synthetase
MPPAILHKRGVFITATGTDTGKTYLSALLVKSLKAEGIHCAYYKPVLSGLIQRPDGGIDSDAVSVAQKAGLDDSSCVVSYQYKAPFSPHLAARQEGNPPRLARIIADWKRVSAAHSFVVVEGAGGVICPLRCGADGLLLQEAVIKSLRLDTFIVSGAALGSINSAVLSAAYLKQRRIRALGFILNRWHGGLLEEDNKLMIERLSGLPVLATVQEGADTLDWR